MKSPSCESGSAHFRPFVPRARVQYRYSDSLCRTVYTGFFVPVLGTVLSTCTGIYRVRTGYVHLGKVYSPVYEYLYYKVY